MRLYIGLDLPGHIKQSLLKSQARMKKLGVQGKWKAPEYLHITLEFLGELSPESVPALTQLLEEVVKDQKRFRLHIGQLGAFPSFNRAHTLWAGVGGDLDKLQGLRSELHSELARNGYELQLASFTPHITLLTRPTSNVTDLASFPLSNVGSFTLSEVILFESKMEDGQRVYPHVYGARLKRV